MPKCTECDDFIKDIDPCIACGSCSQIFHVKKECTGVNSSELKVLELKGQRRLIYNCKDCLAKGGNSVLLETIVEIKEELSIIKKNMEPLQELSALKNEITELKERIGPKNVSEEFERINGELDLLKNQNQNQTSEEIIEEINLRNRKANNFIVYNILDTDKSADDIKILKTVFSDVIPNPAAMYVKRLGEFDANKDRPILMDAGSILKKIEILKKKNDISSKIGNATRNATVSISSDRTTAQREYLKEVLASLDQRKQKGEKNITIKYINDVPKIVAIKDKRGQGNSGTARKTHVS